MSDTQEIEFNNEQAFNEGWGVFDSDGSENGRWQLCRLDEAETFPDDDAAWLHVVSAAMYGSKYHHAALEFIREHNPLEFGCIRDWTLHSWGKLPVILLQPSDAIRPDAVSNR